MNQDTVKLLLALIYSAIRGNQLLASERVLYRSGLSVGVPTLDIDLLILVQIA